MSHDSVRSGFFHLRARRRRHGIIQKLKSPPSLLLIPMHVIVLVGLLTFQLDVLSLCHNQTRALEDLCICGPLRAEGGKERCFNKEFVQLIISPLPIFSLSALPIYQKCTQPFYSFPHGIYNYFAELRGKLPSPYIRGQAPSQLNLQKQHEYKHS